MGEYNTPMKNNITKDQTKENNGLESIEERYRGEKGGSRGNGGKENEGKERKRGKTNGFPFSER